MKRRKTEKKQWVVDLEDKEICSKNLRSQKLTKGETHDLIVDKSFMYPKESAYTLCRHRKWRYVFAAAEVV